MHGAMGLLISALIGAEGSLPAAPPSSPPLAGVIATRVDAREAREIWPLSLSEATRISLDNSEIVRIIEFGPQAPTGTKETMIARVDADMDLWRFQAEVMAHLRSVEQQYWTLAQQNEQLKSSEKAVGLAEEIVRREQSELEVGRGTAADVAEAQQRLEQFRLDLVTKTSDVLTTERQLRSILGLRPADRRRIVPVTPLVEERREPDWAESLATMQERQPDILQQREAVRRAEERALIAIAREMIVLVFGSPSSREGAAEKSREAQDTLLKQRAYLRQVVHQTTHSLARFFLEVDANYKQFKTASRLRAAAAQRLDAQRAFYEEGRITIDRYLDAVSQYASSVAFEAQFKATYNIGLAALEEARGTLLSARGITVIAGPKRVTPVAPVPCQGCQALNVSQGGESPD